MNISDPPAAPEESLAAISYAIAYEVLPHYVFHDREKLIAMFREKPASTGAFFYVMGCQVRQCESQREIAVQFQARHGKLDEAHEFYLLEYPVPPPFDLSGVDMERLPPGAMPVLAPHFSAMIIRRDSGDVRYFVLGQAPLGGTTLRAVAGDGRNSNLGHGSEPNADAFLEQIRGRG